MALFLECLTCVLNCTQYIWLTVFLVVLLYYGFSLTGILHDTIVSVQRNVSEAVQSWQNTKTFNAALCLTSGGLLLIGLYLTLNHPYIGHVVCFLGMFLTYNSITYVFSDITKVSTIAQILFECVISVRYYAFYLMLDPSLRSTGFSLLFIGFFADVLKLHLQKVAEVNSRRMSREGR